MSSFNFIPRPYTPECVQPSSWTATPTRLVVRVTSYLLLAMLPSAKTQMSSKFLTRRYRKNRDKIHSTKRKVVNTNGSIS